LTNRTRSRGAMTTSPGLGCRPSAPGPTWTPSYPGGAHRQRNRPTSEAKLPTTTTPTSHGADTPPQVARLMVTGWSRTLRPRLRARAVDEWLLDAIERDEALYNMRDLDDWPSCGLPRECPERRGRGGRRGDFAWSAPSNFAAGSDRERLMTLGPLAYRPGNHAPGDAVAPSRRSSCSSRLRVALPRRSATSTTSWVGSSG